MATTSTSKASGGCTGYAKPAMSSISICGRMNKPMSKGEITAPLGLTREDIRQALIEGGISPTARHMLDAISYIRDAARDWAKTALVEYVEKHVDYVPLEKKDWS